MCVLSDGERQCCASVSLSMASMPAPPGFFHSLLRCSQTHSTLLFDGQSAEENRPVLGAGRGRVILIRGSVQRLRGAQLSKGLEGGTKGMRGRWEERETLERYMG